MNLVKNNSLWQTSLDHNLQKVWIIVSLDDQKELETYMLLSKQTKNALYHFLPHLLDYLLKS